MSYSDILQNLLVNNKFEIIETNEILKEKEIIGLYFSASYCPPCKKFTPLLKDAYEKIKSNCEIIMIPSDKTEDNYINYYENMPWLSLPYEKRKLKEILCSIFEVKTIPQLVFISKDLKKIMTDGRYFITDNLENISIDLILENMVKYERYN
jgi:nucleoredoxin